MRDRQNVLKFLEIWCLAFLCSQHYLRALSIKKRFNRRWLWFANVWPSFAKTFSHTLCYNCVSFQTVYELLPRPWVLILKLVLFFSLETIWNCLHDYIFGSYGKPNFVSTNITPYKTQNTIWSFPTWKP